MGESTITVTDATFDADVKQSDHTVLVDYWAEWCGPCRMVAPILEEISTKHEGPSPRRLLGSRRFRCWRSTPGASWSRPSSGPSPSRH